MVWLSDLQKETLLLVDKMIEEKKTFEEISDYLYNNGFMFSVETKNGYTSKTHYRIEKKIENEGKIQYKYTFVDLIKRRNGLAYWETIKIS
jgi:hypothetical protein